MHINNDTIIITVVLTYHNRKQKTLKALTSLMKNRIAPLFNCCFNIVACDDGSTDGTSSEIKNNFSNLKIVCGDGDLYWARGMAKALEEAEKLDTDFFLMINDDVEFFDNAVDIMLMSYYSIGLDNVAITGATIDFSDSSYTYGGCIISNRNHINVLPSKDCQECDLANWNCFLLPANLYKMIGKIDSYYEHSYADYDYSYRIKMHGGKIFVANSYIGKCNRNSIKGTWLDKDLSLFDRLKKLHKKSGLPIKSQIHYHKKYSGWIWLYYIIKPYLIILRDSLQKIGA